MSVIVRLRINYTQHVLFNNFFLLFICSCYTIGNHQLQTFFRHWISLWFLIFSMTKLDTFRPKAFSFILVTTRRQGTMQLSNWKLLQKLEIDISPHRWASKPTINVIIEFIDFNTKISSLIKIIVVSLKHLCY